MLMPVLVLLGMHQKMLNKSPMAETCTEEVYAISEDNGSEKSGQA
jgi:hypothetical protein